MSAADRKRIVLGSEQHRKHVGALVASLDRGWIVTLDPPKRTLPQNNTLHMLIADAVSGGIATKSGRRLTEEEAKTAFVSGWMIEQNIGSDIVDGFEDEPVQLRRSTTKFSKKELSSLIDYVLSVCASRGIAVRDPVELGRAA